MKADVDANGKAVSGSKKKKVLAYINGLSLDKEQKDVLYLAAGYAEKGLPETPWAKGESAVPLLPGLDGKSRETESSAPMALPLPGTAEKKRHRSRSPAWDNRQEGRKRDPGTETGYRGLFA